MSGFSTTQDEPCMVCGKPAKWKKRLPVTITVTVPGMRAGTKPTMISNTVYAHAECVMENNAAEGHGVFPPINDFVKKHHLSK